MNLLPIIYSSLLIFCTLTVIIIFSSFILYKLKGTKVKNSIEEIPFVLRRPVTLATANSNIVYKKATVSTNHSNKVIVKKPYSQRANKPYSDAQLNNKIIKAAYEHFTHNKERRYQVLTSSIRQQQGGGYVGNNYQQNLYSPHYFYENFNNSRHSSGNGSSL